MKSCVFRSLTERDYDILRCYKFIPCGLSDEYTGTYNYYFDNKMKYALDNVNSHITNGSKINTPWISCSKDFITTIKKYTLSTSDYEMLLRPYVAVIRHHNQTDIEIKEEEIEKLKLIAKASDKIDFIRNLHVNKIRKLVLDISDEYQFKELFEIGLLRNQNGTLSKGGSLALSYAKASDEILVFNQIPKAPKKSFTNLDLLDQSNIPFILSPLAYDVIYSLIMNNDMTENSSYKEFLKVYLFVNEQNNFSHLLTETEKDFYELYYSRRLQIRTILQSVNNPRIDYMSLYVELLKLKMSILKKIIMKYNENKRTNYSTVPQICFEEKELIENSEDCCDMNLELINTKIFIKKL